MNTAPKKELTLLDCIGLIVGIIVGTGIYLVVPDVAKGAAGAAGFLGIWILGGLLSLCGALGYAELATAYPEEGGDYAYLTRAYGRWAGFLFGWIQLAIVRPGDIAVMAFAFAKYAAVILGLSTAASGAMQERLTACAAVVALTAIHIAGVRQGKWTQNILTLVKVVGLGLIVTVAWLAPREGSAAAAAAGPLPASLALILVLFTFGGWNEMAYVAAEVRHPERNIRRALILGTLAVTGLYLLVNAAFLFALGYPGLTQSKAVGADVVSRVFPHAAGSLVSGLICLSALGAVSGLIFTGARISYAMGRDHRLFAPLGRWNDRTGTPLGALIGQAAIAIALILLLGSFIDTLIYTAAPVYLFYLASNLAVIVLRWKDPATARPYRVLGYPITPLVFCGTCAFLIYSAVMYKPQVALAALGILAAGLPVFWLSNRLGRPRT
ncbi:MAG TPA: amino acid permease [Candidatus Paceibacterota bacterium]|nr:amino acid permease [Verrucomicrobiota bacterium]HRZ46796.1 amino acid permease [Candidatus Paceibacterota bacterium]HRZ92610.1 amino acid permease [Candidatus Paceibacterota bacterium]